MALFESSTDAINIPPSARASRVRTAVDRWLALCVPAPRPRIAPTPSAPRTLRDLRDAWFVAELECALALRAWQLADRADAVRVSHSSYSQWLVRVSGAVPPPHASGDCWRSGA